MIFCGFLSISQHVSHLKSRKNALCAPLDLSNNVLVYLKVICPVFCAHKIENPSKTHKNEVSVHGYGYFTDWIQIYSKVSVDYPCICLVLLLLSH
jgi:hypothetical protein